MFRLLIISLCIKTYSGQFSGPTSVLRPDSEEEGDPYIAWQRERLTIPIYKKSDLGCSYSDVEELAFEAGQCMLLRAMDLITHLDLYGFEERDLFDNNYCKYFEEMAQCAHGTAFVCHSKDHWKEYYTSAAYRVGTILMMALGRVYIPFPERFQIRNTHKNLICPGMLRLHYHIFDVLHHGRNGTTRYHAYEGNGECKHHQNFAEYRHVGECIMDVEYRVSLLMADIRERLEGSSGMLPIDMITDEACKVNELLRADACISECHDKPDLEKLAMMIEDTKKELMYYLVQLDPEYSWQRCQ